MWCMMNVWRLIFFFNDTATTEIYTLSLHDALPIWLRSRAYRGLRRGGHRPRVSFRVARDMERERSGRFLLRGARFREGRQDRKSTRLNSSHANISYAVFCLKKKQINTSSVTHSPPI